MMSIDPNAKMNLDHEAGNLAEPQSCRCFPLPGATMREAAEAAAAMPSAGDVLRAAAARPSLQDALDRASEAFGRFAADIQRLLESRRPEPDVDDPTRTIFMPEPEQRPDWTTIWRKRALDAEERLANMSVQHSLDLAAARAGTDTAAFRSELDRRIRMERRALAAEKELADLRDRLDRSRGRDVTALERQMTRERQENAERVAAAEQETARLVGDKAALKTTLGEMRAKLEDETRRAADLERAVAARDRQIETQAEMLMGWFAKNDAWRAERQTLNDLAKRAEAERLEARKEIEEQTARAERAEATCGRLKATIATLGDVAADATKRADAAEAGR